MRYLELGKRLGLRECVLLLCACLCVAGVRADDVLQFRGPERNGVYHETGLLKSWPQGGPALTLQITGLGDGYSSPAVADGVIYITGISGNTEYLYAFSLDGKLKWKTPYGRTARSYSGSRSTPTVTQNFIYLSSGAGEVVCFNRADGTVKWSVDVSKKFQASWGRWEAAESILVDDGKVFFTTAGDKTTMVALDALTGQTVWTSDSVGGDAGYASPIMIERSGRKHIITITGKYMIGVNPDSGKIEWSIDYLALPSGAMYKGINAPSPVYHDGMVFFTSGYDQPAVMVKLSADGSGAKTEWVNQDLDNHHGNVVYVDGYIYGSNWINNQKGNWLCLDWKTGKKMYEAPWRTTKGSIIYDDGMLYCYEEKGGYVALVRAVPEKFDLVSEFRMTDGSGPHWAHPVISNGKLYIRHGDVLNIYDIKAA